ncbi:hypothetical protein DNTS_025661, partial [Danionella cerebrum]
LESPSQVCSQSKRAGLKRQARLELGADPWIKLTDSPDNQPHCTKTMSDYYGDGEVNGTASENTSKSLDSQSEPATNVKKGPPVAPKPTWVRQSLRSIKSGKPITEALKHSDIRSKDTSRTSGSSLRSTSSGANLSFKQKISSFENFSSVDGAARPSRRLAPTASLPPVEKMTKPSTSYYSTIENPKVSTTNFQNNDSCQSTTIPTTIQPTEEKPVSPSSEIASELPLLEGECQSTQCNSVSVDELPLDSSKEVAFVEETEQCHLTSQKDSLPETHIPRRSSSSKEGPFEKIESPATHVESLRTRSLPLSSPSDAPNSIGLEGERLGIILSFSNQVSSALMRSMQSLPQSPCIRFGNPWSAPPGSPLHNPIEEDSPAENTKASTVTEAKEKGFSVSLAELRECTIERGGESETDECKPEQVLNSASAACAQSMLSVLPPLEIQRMIQEVKDLDDDTLRQLEDIHVVVLHKDEGAGLGFSIAGGIDLENKATTVHRVFPSGLAAQEGTIERGDEVLSINGQTLKHVTHSDAKAILRQARGMRQAVVVVSKNRDPEGKSANANEPTISGPENSVTGEVEVLLFELEKNAGGVGFSLEGGKASINGDRPLTVNRIFTDELLQIQDMSLQGLTRFEAWTLIKNLQDGPFKL